MSDLCIIATGGTIDKIHDPITEKLVFDEKSQIKYMLDVYRVQGIAYDVVMLKDSLEITDTDRSVIVESIKNRSEKRIVITHGTSTMSESASYIAKHIHDKTIVMTGALRPFSLFQSDCGFNLGCAIAVAQSLSEGVYITMNGKIFEADNVRKNIDTGVFEKAS